MPFSIQWTGPLKPATTQRDGPAEALKSAIELFGKGYTDVVIVDWLETAKPMHPAEFAEFYRDTIK